MTTSASTPKIGLASRLVNAILAIAPIFNMAKQGVADLWYESLKMQFSKPRLKPTSGYVQNVHSYLD